MHHAPKAAASRNCALKSAETAICYIKSAGTCMESLVDPAPLSSSLLELEAAYLHTQKVVESYDSYTGCDGDSIRRPAPGEAAHHGCVPAALNLERMLAFERFLGRRPFKADVETFVSRGGRVRLLIFPA